MAVDAAAPETLPTLRPPRATLTKARRLGATALAGLGDLLYPPACPACGADTARRPALCPACFAATRLLDAHTPACALCARPEPRLGAPDPGFVCDRCRAAPPVVDALRAAGVYEGALRRLVLALKHADRQDTAALMGGWLARRGADWLAEATHVAPVSLHWRRRLARRGNQAALLAAAACRAAGRPGLYAPGLLQRSRATRSQGDLDRAARRANLAGAIALARRGRIEGARVVLIDDVATTGATLDAAASALKAGGAASVTALVVALVPHGAAPYLPAEPEEEP